MSSDPPPLGHEEVSEAPSPPEEAGELPSGLSPGAGTPLVPGPPRSVRGPARAARINALLGAAGILVIVLIAVAAVLLVVLAVHLLRG